MVWLDLTGAVNARDVGGLPAGDRAVLPNRLIRSDNLQDLTADDMRLLVDGCGVRSVADLRTDVEVASTGPGPMTREPRVELHHLSLFPEVGRTTDVTATESTAVEAAEGSAARGGPTESAATENDAAGSQAPHIDDQPPILPWQDRPADRQGAVRTYLGYLQDRPDSVVSALRLVAESDGATIVHCAAGKDRTGVVVALALDVVGVDRAAIVEDYVATGERIDALLDRLRASPTYADDVDRVSSDRHRPKAATMWGLLESVDADYGGTEAFLRKHGWTDEDAAALRLRLLGY
jgi:protein tyrosine/serine phosphatase